MLDGKLVVAAASLAVAALGIPATLANIRRGRSELTTAWFRRVFTYLRERQSELNATAFSAARPAWKAAEIPLLTRPGWIPYVPAPLDVVHLIWQNTPADRLLEPALDRARRLMPRTAGGSRFRKYSDALIEVLGMDHLYNGSTYRPLEIVSKDGALHIACCLGRYFDHLDTSEVLAFEAAAVDLGARRGRRRQAYRRYLRDPFDLRRRSTGLGINTLTIRRGAQHCEFYMHRRAERYAVEAPDVVHVVPAGEFAPSDIGLQAQQADFDIWRTIVREYAEEFLNVEEAYGRGGRPLDYARAAPYRELESARSEGLLTVHLLGVGLDPLSWKLEMLTLCIFEGVAFDSIFAKMVAHGPEGTILGGRGNEGLPFDEETLQRYVMHPNTLGTAKACLTLAWRHREQLGLNRPAGVS
jgi:hypothetical protein